MIPMIPCVALLQGPRYLLSAKIGSLSPGMRGNPTFASNVGIIASVIMFGYQWSCSLQSKVSSHTWSPRTTIIELSVGDVAIGDAVEAAEFI
jgi:hypothetical protein